MQKLELVLWMILWHNPKKKTVVILDNSPIHRSRMFMAKMKEWEEQDVLIFFLPPHSPELNLIEILWKRIKYPYTIKLELNH